MKELAAAYYVFKDAGVEIKLASPNSRGPPLEPKSNEPNFRTDLTLRFDKDRVALAQLDKTVRLDSVKQEDSNTVSYPGGHGAMWDLAEDKDSIKLIEPFLAAGKTIAVVCHSTGALRHVKTSDGKRLIQGKEMTGFTDGEEEEVGLTKVLPWRAQALLRIRVRVNAFEALNTDLRNKVRHKRKLRMEAERPPLPPFTTIESAVQKVRLAEDAWNSRDPVRVSLGYTPDSRWRNRAEFVEGREQIQAFLTRKWTRELDYRLIKELWAYTGHRIAVRFVYEWRDDSGNWFRSYGNENWEFEPNGLMSRRHACINDLPIMPEDRLFHWPLGRRADDHPSLSDLGL